VVNVAAITLTCCERDVDWFPSEDIMGHGEHVEGVCGRRPQSWQSVNVEYVMDWVASWSSHAAMIRRHVEVPEKNVISCKEVKLIKIDSKKT